MLSMGKDCKEEAYDIELVLGKTIKELKENFENTWSTYKYECDYLKKFYHASIQIFLNKFEEYESSDQIERDFSAAIGRWDRNKGKMNDALFNSYSIILFIYQVYFLEAFVRKLAIVDSFVTPPEIPVDVHVDIDNATDEILKNYKKKLGTHIFENIGEKLKYILNAELMMVKKQIRQFNQTPVLDYKSTCFYDNKAEGMGKIPELFAEEVNQLKFKKKWKSRCDEFEELQLKRNQVIHKNNQYISELIQKIKLKSKSFPDIDLLQHTEYKKEKDKLNAIHQYRDYLLRTNFMSDKQKDALEKIKECIHDLGARILTYKKNLSYRTWVFGYDASPIFEASKKFLEKSKILRPVDQKIEEEIARFQQVLPKLEKKHEKIESELRLSIQEKMSESAKEKYYDEAIQCKRYELIEYLTNIPELKLIKNTEFEKAKKELKKAWHPYLSSHQGRREVEKFLLINKEKLDASKDEKDAVYFTMANIFIKNKIKKYEKYETEIKKINKYPLISVVASHSPRVVYPEKKKPRWYELNQPWKKALVAGIAMLVLAGLASSVFGLAFGLTFLAFVGILSGGLVASIGAGSFSIGFFGILSWEYRFRCGGEPTILPEENTPELMPQSSFQHKEICDTKEPMLKSGTRFFSSKIAENSNKVAASDHVQTFRL